MKRRGPVLLRQVLCNHGHCVPPFRLGGLRAWLPLLPGPELAAAMDRCTVVLPRPGDGFYAPPPGGNEDGDAGFPWGELTDRGAEEMQRAGRRHLGHLDASRLLVRAANRPRSVAGAQAAVWGAAAELPHPSPVEVLLQGGEDLVPRRGPASEFELPAELVDVRRRSELDWDRLLEAALCLEGAGVEAGLAFSAAERGALRRLAWDRGAAELRPEGGVAPTPVGETIGPLLRELFRACDAALADHLGADTVFYVSQADALACTMAAFGLEGATPPCWPAFGEALEVTLVEEAGQPCLHFERGGEALMPTGGELGASVAATGDGRVAQSLPLATAKAFFAPVLDDDI